MKPKTGLGVMPFGNSDRASVLTIDTFGEV